MSIQQQKRKDWQFKLKVEIKRIDREIKRNENERTRAQRGLETAARRGSGVQAVQPLAVSLVRLRSAGTRLQKARAALHAVDLELTVLGAAHVAKGEALTISADLMHEMDKLANVPEIAESEEMQEVYRELAAHASKDLLGQTVEEARKNAEEERAQESKEAIEKVQSLLEELGLEQLGPLSDEWLAKAAETEDAALKAAAEEEKERRAAAAEAATDVQGTVPRKVVVGTRIGQAESKPRKPLGALVGVAALALAVVGAAVLAPRLGASSQAPLKGAGLGSRSGTTGSTGDAWAPEELTQAGTYDLRVFHDGKLLGCASPASRFPGQAKYSCAGKFSKKQRCDAVSHPIKDTEYVKAVHDGCETSGGGGTYGYPFDDKVGLRQCAPFTRYEWILCATGSEGPLNWNTEAGPGNSTRRFRVTNRCKEDVWVQQVGQQLPHEPELRLLMSGEHHTFAVPDRGHPAATFIPKTGCDPTGHHCAVERSAVPGINSRFGASWGCLLARGDHTDFERCTLTAEGQPSTYRDWWDASAVQGWTMPFSILVDSGNKEGRAACKSVVCAKLDAARLCPRAEFLTPLIV